MNFNGQCKVSKINFENLGKNEYTILKNNEHTEPNNCALHHIDLSQNNDSTLLIHNCNTKLIILSLSIIGIYTFSCVVFSKKNFY